MRYLKGLVAVVAIALVVAACSPQETEFNVDPQAFINPPIFAPDINWDIGDGYHVDVYGMGMGDDLEVTNNPATIVIPDPGNVVMIRMQVQIKGGPDDFPYTVPDSVDFATDGVESVSVNALNTGVGTDGFFETNFGWHYNASFTFAGATEVTATVYENGGVADEPCLAQCTPRAFKVWVFRTPDASNPANSGGLFQDDLWWGTKGSATPFPRFTNTHSLNIPAAAGPRDVTVEVAFSDLANDGRTAQVDIAADGLSASETYDNTSPGYERESLIASLTLPDVPGDVTSVDITFTSPDGTDVDNASVDGGDSFFVSGAAVTADEPDGGGDGCTPGYWRQEHHFDSWTNYDPNTDFYDAVFGVDATLRTRGGPGRGPVPTVDDATLLGAVWAAGGGENALARHAVAALLNANSPDVDYFYSEAEIIALVQDAYANDTFGANKNLLAAQNGDDTFCGLN